MSEYLVFHHPTIENLADDVYSLVARSAFTKPGFALIKQPSCTSSTEQREFLHQLKTELSRLLEEREGESLGYFSLNRFDQKQTTRPHRDGAPTQSLLLLGYEPTKIESQLAIYDYSRCAFFMNMTPDEFLECYNPMWDYSIEKLTDHKTVIKEFEPGEYQVLVVNNSSSSFSRLTSTWQGVLHSAEIKSDTKNATRLINSVTVIRMGVDEKEPVAEEDQRNFMQGDFEIGSYAS